MDNHSKSFNFKEKTSDNVNLGETMSNYNTYNLDDIEVFRYKNFEKNVLLNSRHLTKEIGETDHMNPSNYDRSTFTSVVNYIEELSESFRNENKIISKNLHYISSKLIDLDENSRMELSKFTKDTGNKLLNSYEHYSNLINKQRCENLRLQNEINLLIKEKNSLKHDVKNLIYATDKLETFLGVSTNNNDCTVKSDKLENAIFENKTKPLLVKHK